MSVRSPTVARTPLIPWSVAGDSRLPAVGVIAIVVVEIIDIVVAAIILVDPGRVITSDPAWSRWSCRTISVRNGPGAGSSTLCGDRTTTGTNACSLAPVVVGVRRGVDLVLVIVVVAKVVPNDPSPDALVEAEERRSDPSDDERCDQQRNRPVSSLLIDRRAVALAEGTHVGAERCPTAELHPGLGGDGKWHDGHVNRGYEEH